MQQFAAIAAQAPGQEDLLPVNASQLPGTVKGQPNPAPLRAKFAPLCGRRAIVRNIDRIAVGAVAVSLVNGVESAEQVPQCILDPAEAAIKCGTVNRDVHECVCGAGVLQPCF